MMVEFNLELFQGLQTPAKVRVFPVGHMGSVICGVHVVQGLLATCLVLLYI